MAAARFSQVGLKALEQKAITNFGSRAVMDAIELVFGALFLIAMVAVPAIYFWRHTDGETDRSWKFIALMGCLFIPAIIGLLLSAH